jgi:peptidyl-tRNA hydrolase, PTH2 family
MEVTDLLDWRIGVALAAGLSIGWVAHWKLSAGEAGSPAPTPTEKPALKVDPTLDIDDDLDGEDEDEDEEVDSESEGDSEDDEDGTGVPPGELKMILVVRKDLKMGKGKIGAQCGHATLGSYRRALRTDLGLSWVRAWLYRGQKKVCLQADSKEDLLAVARACREADIPCYVVVSERGLSTGPRTCDTAAQADAGHTQVEPGSLTVLGIGPCPSDVIDRITGPKGSHAMKLLS